MRASVPGGTLDGALGRVVAWSSMGTPAGHSGAAVRCILEGALECAPGGRGGRADVHSGSRPARPGRPGRVGDRLRHSAPVQGAASCTSSRRSSCASERFGAIAIARSTCASAFSPRPVAASTGPRFTCGASSGRTQVLGGTLRCAPAVSRRALHRRARWRGPPWQSHARPALRGDSPPVAPAIAALGFNPRPPAPGGTSAYRTGSTASVKSCPRAQGCSAENGEQPHPGRPYPPERGDAAAEETEASWGIPLSPRQGGDDPTRGCRRQKPRPRSTPCPSRDAT